jgi:hypothetical protein
VLLHSVEFGTVRRQLFAYIEREGMEAMLELDKRANIQAVLILSRTLILAGEAVVIMHKVRQLVGK